MKTRKNKNLSHVHTGIDSTVVLARKVNISSAKNGKSFLRKCRAATLGPFFLFFSSSFLFLPVSSISKAPGCFFFAEKLILTHSLTLKLKMRLSNARYTPPTNQSCVEVGCNSVDLVSFCIVKKKNCPFHRVLSSPPHHFTLLFNAKFFGFEFVFRFEVWVEEIIMGQPQME